MKFETGDRVQVNYQGADMMELEDAGISTRFTGTIVRGKPSFLGPIYQVISDDRVSPFYRDSDNDDPNWYVLEHELEAA